MGTAAGASDWQDAIFEALKAGNVRQVAYVPDAGHSQLGITVLRASNPGEVAELVSAGMAAAFEAGEQVAVLLGQNLIGRKKWETK